jgi:hypothetical protein
MKIYEVLNELEIKIIKCGANHTLVLTSSGEVYAWGKNSDGEIGNGCYKDQLTPIKLNDFNDEKVVMISCGGWHSMALTESGRVFSWGYNSIGQLGQGNTINSNIPELIEMKEIKIIKISCGLRHSLLLSNNGDIYTFGDNDRGQLGNGNRESQSTPFKLDQKNKFIDIAAHFWEQISVSLSIDNIFYVWGQCGEKNILTPINTNFKTFNQVFSNYTSRQYEASDKLIEFEDSLFRFDYYIKKYEEIEELGGGSFGTVFKVKEKSDGKRLYAIKKIELKNDKEKESLKEFYSYYVANRLHNDFIVGHYDAWFEKKEKISDKMLLLYIKMELCDKTLKEIIEEIRNDSHLRKNNILTPIGYYLASSLFIEILNGVQYLHEKNIIHRDLKPLNILLKETKIYNYNTGSRSTYIKIADFGLSVLHKYSEQSHTIDKGTPKYMAPEVINNNKYDFKADIYSLGIIFEELIHLDTMW